MTIFNPEGGLAMLILVVGLLGLLALPLLVLAGPLFVWLLIPALGLALLAIVNAFRRHRPMIPSHT
jgi:hypothetical protein